MAKSKSTSDVCSECGKRIDKCVPPCPVAVSLLTRAMHPLNKAIRIEEIMGQLQALSSELWDLVEPTKEEITATQEQYWDMSQDDLIDMLVTDSKDAWGIAINTCQDVLDYREEEAQS